MQKPFVRVGSQDACERCGLSDARRAQGDVGRLRRRLEGWLDAEVVGDETEQMVPLGRGKTCVLVTPAIEFEPLSHTGFLPHASLLRLFSICGEATHHQKH